MMNSIMILFCLFLGVIGFFLIFSPRNKRKSNIMITSVYSSFFLILAIYLLYSTFIKKVNWEKNSEGVYTSQCNVFEKANLFLLEHDAIKLFLENENNLIERYVKNNVKCIKQRTTLFQEKSCNHVLKSFNEDLNYGVLVVSSKNMNYIYLIDSGTIYDWCFKCY